MAEIEDCACGTDHEVMPTDEMETCGCAPSWAPGAYIDPNCSHPTVTYELVCRTHKRHIPCRPCMKEDD